MATQLTEKHPYEEYFVEFDFTNDLYDQSTATAETIASVADVSAVDEDGTDATTDVTTAANQLNSTSSVFVWVKGGTYLKDYTISVQIVSDAGSKYQIDAVLPIREH